MEIGSRGEKRSPLGYFPSSAPSKRKRTLDSVTLSLGGEKEKEEREGDEKGCRGKQEAKRRLAVGSQGLDVGLQIDGPIVVSVVVRQWRLFVL